MKFLRKIGVRNSLVALIALFVCTGMWGCGWDKEYEDLSSSEIIGFSKDSLVVCLHEKKEEVCYHKPLGADCYSKNYGTSIIVDNFGKEKRIWESDYGHRYDVYDMIDDSTIIALKKDDGTFYEWILGGAKKELGAFSWFGCSNRENVRAIRNWGDGKWRLIGGTEDCAYAIVDVENKIITGYKKLDDFAERCSDLWDHEGVKYCVGTVKKDTIISYYERNLDGIFLKNELMKNDTLWGNQISENNIYSSLIPLYKNSFLWLKTGCCARHLMQIDYVNVKFVYVRKYI